MRIKPIIFNTDMVQAILREDNPKTQTRRAIPYSIQHKYCEYSDYIDITIPPGSPELSTRTSEHDFYMMKSRYQLEDILWVKETWCYHPLALNPFNPWYGYKADGDYRDGFDYHWKSSRFMPKAAARIFLKVTDVRVERLQDISNEDVRSEGVKVANYTFDDDLAYITPSTLLEKHIATHSGKFDDDSLWYREWFCELWDSINGKRDGGIYAYKKNPWVFAISFEQTEKPKEF